MKAVFLAFFALLTANVASAQHDHSAITGLTIGGGASDSCPVLVMGLWTGSPAEKAGIEVGDALVAIDGTPVNRFDDAAKRLHSNDAAPVRRTLLRGDSTFSKTVERETAATLLERSHLRLLSTGAIVPLDMSEEEIRNKMRSLSHDRFADRAFSSHYPTDLKLYYGGFEVLTLRSPAQVVVLGIEDGPASRSGVHWGDTILSVNGVDPRNRSVPELEKLFSNAKPSTMTLKIEREGIVKNFKFKLEEATKVLRDNKNQIIRGVPMPLGIPEKYLPCLFTESN
jgi:C-terminal processing protease CtpA/Prc